MFYLVSLTNLYSFCFTAFKLKMLQLVNAVVIVVVVVDPVVVVAI